MKIEEEAKMYLKNKMILSFDRPNEKRYDVEYIRKDGLLEWAEKQKSQEQGFEDGEAERGYKSAINDLIRYLNMN